MGPNRRSRIGALWLFLGLTWLGLGASLLALQAWQQRGPWQFGQNWGGDLKQHYAVAKMLEENGGDYAPLYRDFHFSVEITRIFNADLYEQGIYLDRHNYRYGPFIAWLSWKLEKIPYRLWIQIWSGLSLILSVGALVLFRKIEEGSGTGPNLLVEAVFFLGFPPLLYGFSIYQNAPLTLFLCSVSAWLLKHDRNWLAGLVFGSICYKPQLMPYIAGIMFLCGQWRFAIGAGWATAFWLGMGLIFCGWDSHRQWVESLFEIVRGVQGDEMATNMPWKGFVLTVVQEKGQALALTLANGLGVLILVGLVYFVHVVKKNAAWSSQHVFYLALLWWLLFTPHVKAYEMVLALPLMMLLLRVNNVSPKLAAGAVTLFYASGFAVVACRFLGFSPGAPLVTVAFLLALAALRGNPSEKKATDLAPVV